MVKRNVNYIWKGRVRDSMPSLTHKHGTRMATLNILSKGQTCSQRNKYKLKSFPCSKETAVPLGPDPARYYTS